MDSNEESNIFLNTKDLSYAKYYEKNVTGDGNCFFRVISYYYRKDENYYNEFRQLILDLFVENIEKFIDFSPHAYIVGNTEPENEEQILHILNQYGEKMGQDKTWAGDIEIATTAHYLGVNINI